MIFLKRWNSIFWMKSVSVNADVCRMLLDVHWPLISKYLGLYLYRYLTAKGLNLKPQWLFMKTSWHGSTFHIADYFEEESTTNRYSPTNCLYGRVCMCQFCFDQNMSMFWDAMPFVRRHWIAFHCFSLWRYISRLNEHHLRSSMSVSSYGHQLIPFQLG